MKKVDVTKLGNWGSFIIKNIIHPFTVIITPTFMLGLIIYMIVIAFGKGIPDGIRSFSGVILPMIVVTFIFLFQKDLLEWLGKIHVLLSYALSLIIGILVMWVVSCLGSSDGVPVTEIVLSSSFSIIIFSYVFVQENKMLSYYYGIVSGFLIFFILFGFPELI